MAPPKNPKKHLCRALLGKLGIVLPREKDRLVVLTRRFPFLVLGLFLAVLLGFGLFVHHTGTPEFCNDCHFIEPYYESWKTSSHNEVNCLKCHYPPGWKNYVRGKVAGLSELVKTITKTAGPKPHAEVEDAACLREGCHQTRLLQGKVTFKGKYRLDHGTHLGELRRGKQLRCTTCHSQIVQGRHITVTESVCFTCHFKGKIGPRALDPIGGCTSCHEVPEEPIELAGGQQFQHRPFIEQGARCEQCHLDSVQGTGEVPRQVCLDCHDEPDKLKRYSDSDFMHRWHVTRRKVECFQCHSEIRHGMQPAPQGGAGDCQQCHRADHFPARDLYRGRGGRGVPESPGVHATRQLDCVACHQHLGPGLQHGVDQIQTFVAAKEACAECHGSGAGQMLEMWKKVLKQRLASTADAIEEARKALDATGETNEEVEKLLEDAAHNYRLVKTGRGTHNPGYAFGLLDKAQQWAGEASRLLKDQESGTREDER